MRSKEKRKEYYQKNREKILEQQRQQYIKHRHRKRAYAKKYNEEHKEENRTYSAEYNRRIKQEVMAHYGGVCDCCGEDKLEFLSIDHINGNGRAHRREVNAKSINIWLRNNNYPEGFRVLCFNCNCSLGFYGYCPHKEQGNRGWK